MIDRFQGEFRWLSNFTGANVEFEGLVFPSVENAYVAAKTLDKRLRPILQKVSASEAKYLGKLLPLRPSWGSVKLPIMESLLRQKFSYQWFSARLAETGNQEIVEGNTWHDLWWGICTCSEHNGQGENNLGKLIMKIRGESKQLPLDFS